MKESGFVHEACKWCYRGVWGVLARYFKMPTEPPHLPSLDGEEVEYLHPSEEFLAYRKFFFWIGLAIVDVILTAIWIGIIIWWPLFGFLISPIALFIIIVPDIIAYIAIHLRYDTTWYVLTDRSMRLRRGIWSLHETTITFENIQNIHMQQGPIERWFGFANLIVQTAGGGGGGADGKGGGIHAGAHVGILEGLKDAAGVRERILAHCQTSKRSGLGDESEAELKESKRLAAASMPALLQHSVVTLREIRDLTSQLARESR